MHFIYELIQSPQLKDPANKHKKIHRHFYRYSKGDFTGPVMKISQTKAKITLKGTHEYEDLILELVSMSISDPNEEFEINGRLITGSEISGLLTELGFNWDLKKSTGQTKNYKAEIIDNITKDKLVKSVEAFREHSYLLLSFILNPSCKVTTKKKVPQPSKKKVEDEDINKRVQFCVGYLNNTDENLKNTINFIIPDFKSELPKNWKTLTVVNNYKITEIEIPKNIKDSRLLRIMAVRKGKLIRSLDIDGEILEKQYSIVV